MDISQLLEEKKQKLEQLRLQRIELEEVPNVEKQDTVEVSLQEIPQVKYDIPPPIIPKIEPVLPLQDADIEELESKLRKELEIKVRAELEDKYRKYYESAVQDLTKTQRPHSLQSEEGKEKCEFTPTKTKVKYIDVHENSCLSVHDDCIQIYKLPSLTIIGKIPLHSKANVAVFDRTNNERIIVGYENGFVHVYTPAFCVSSRYQLDSIIAIHQSLNSVIIVSSAGEYTVLAPNIIDVLIPATNIFTALQFSHNEVLKTLHPLKVITVCSFVGANNVILGLVTGDILSVDIGTHTITKIHKSSLPPLSISYTSGKTLVLSLDHSLTIIHGDTVEHDVGFSFLAKWITPSAFLTCTFQNELSIWSDNKKSKIHIIEGSTVSAIEILDSKTLVVADLEGNCKLFEM